jgi:hypothetical protein
MTSSDFEDVFLIGFETVMDIGMQPFQGERAAFLVQETVLAFPGCAQFTGNGIQDAVAQRQFHAVIGFDARQNIDGITEADHGFVLRFHREHRAGDAQFFHFCVIRTDLIKKVDARFFEPTDVIRMVDDFHLICFVILGQVYIGF